MSAICQPSLSPLVARLSSNEPFPLRRFRVKLCGPSARISFAAIGASAQAVEREAFEKAHALFGPVFAVSVREVRT